MRTESLNLNPKLMKRRAFWQWCDSQNGISVMLRDVTIRAPLDKWLRKLHCEHEDAEIIHELKMPRPSARIDIAVVNGELCGFEIKSDVDSLARLERQQKAFSSVFDRVSLVTTEKHLTQSEKLLPEWWGIICARPFKKQLSLTSVRAAKSNNAIDIMALTHLLSCRELRLCLSGLSCAPSKNSLRRYSLIDEITRDYEVERIKQNVLALLKKRTRRDHEDSCSA